MHSVLKSEQFGVGNGSEGGVETSIGSGSRDLVSARSKEIFVVEMG